MPGCYPLPWARAASVLIAMVSLSTCGSDTPTGTSGHGTVEFDASAILASSDSFHVRLDRFELVVRQAGSSAVLASKTFSGAELAVRPLVFTVPVPVDAATEQVAADVRGFAIDVPYFAASDSGSLAEGGTFSAVPPAPTYVGQGMDADSMTFVLDTTIASGDSVLLTAQALHAGGAESGVPVAFLSSDSQLVRIRRPAALGVNQAWAVAVGDGPDSTILTARLPGANGPHASGQIGLEPAPSTVYDVYMARLVHVEDTIEASAIVLTAGLKHYRGQLVSFTVTGPTGTHLDATNAVTDSMGLATVHLISGAAIGSFTLTASASFHGHLLTGSPRSVTGTITRTVPAQAQYTALTPLHQSTRIGEKVAQPPAVLVSDSAGHPVVGAEVVFDINGCGCVEYINGFPYSITLVTDSAGIVRLSEWELGRYPQEPYAIKVGSLTFTVTGMIGRPFALYQVSGEGQIGRAGQPLGQHIVVLVNDPGANAVPGATVHFQAADGSVAPVDAITDSGGRAGVVWTLGTAPAESLIARIDSAGPVVFHATTVAGSNPLTLTGDAVYDIYSYNLVTAHLGVPAAAGTILTLQSDDTIAIAVFPIADTLNAGDTVAAFTAFANGGGTTRLRVQGAGYAEASLAIVIKGITGPAKYNLAIGAATTITFRLAVPAPGGGLPVLIEVLGDSGIVAIDPSTITIPAGGTSGSYTLTRVGPGIAFVRVSSPGYQEYVIFPQ